MEFIDFFAGIGGIRLGLERAGHKCIGFCEFDKFARQSYKAIHDTTDEWEAHDVRAITSADVPRADLWCFGFPCQDLSAAGKQKGLQAGERSGLFYEIVRLLAGTQKENRPGWLLCENVKNLLNIGGGFDFLRLLIELGELGYDMEWQVLNSKDFGVPQNRERVFLVGHFRNRGSRKVFPISPPSGENPCQLQEITRKVPMSQRVYDPQGVSSTLNALGGGMGAKTGLYAVSGIDLTTNKPKLTDFARCLQSRYNKGYSTRQGECSGVLYGANITKNTVKVVDKSVTLDAHYFKGVGANQARTGVLDFGTDNIKIRKLTPRECWRLQGFPDAMIDKVIASGVSDSQLYKQAGNAVTVNVAEAIGKKLKQIEDDAE